MDVVLLDEIAARMGEIVDIEKRRTPSGIVEPVTQQIRELRARAFELVFDRPVFTVSIKNEGPNPVFRSVNVINKPLRMLVNDESNVNFTEAMIDRIFFWVETAGEIANLRIDTIR